MTAPERFADSPIPLALYTCRRPARCWRSPWSTATIRLASAITMGLFAEMKRDQRYRSEAPVWTGVAASALLIVTQPWPAVSPSGIAARGD